MTDPLERVIRPIVEGQIRGFLKEHPAIVEAVNWYKRRPDKATTFVNSLGKRITLDLLCPLTRKRIEAALFEIWESEKSGVEPLTAPDGADVGKASDVTPVQSWHMNCDEGGQIGTPTDLVARRHEIEEGTYQPDHMDWAA